MKRTIKHILWKKISSLLGVLGILCIAFACQREDDIKKKVIFSENLSIQSYSEFFEIFWNAMNDRYIYWQEETVDWEEMYRIYKPKFAALDTLYIDKGTPSDSLGQYVVDMIKDLKDAQIGFGLNSAPKITFENYEGNYTSFWPKVFRLNTMYTSLPDTLFDYIIGDTYIDKKTYNVGVYSSLLDGSVVQISYGNISPSLTSKKVVFAGINYGFAFNEGVEDTRIFRYPVRPVITKLFAALKNCDAFILDLRNNRGGQPKDITFFAGRLSTTAFDIGYMRNKSSTGRLDYTPFIPIRVIPQKDAFDYTKQIVILTNKYTGAVAETMVMALKTLPNAQVTVIGDNTYGSPGYFLGTSQTHNAGSFQLPSIGVFFLSSSAIADKNYHFNFDGIAPDKRHTLSKSQIEQIKEDGVDTQLEAAIHFVNTGN